MNNIEITVFTPSYNRAATLPRAFECLKKQTFRNFEWIIIDDGSSDNTREVVEGFKKENPFFDISMFFRKIRANTLQPTMRSEFAEVGFLSRLTLTTPAPTMRWKPF